MSDEKRKPLTALEWLRVTHADTLSGRRIEEALVDAYRSGVADAERGIYVPGSAELDAAEARGRAEVVAKVEAVAVLMGKWRAEDSFVSDPEGITRMWRDFLRDEIRALDGER